MDRRDFLRRTQRAGVGTLCAAAGGGLLAACSSLRYATYQRQGDLLVVPLAEFAEGNFVFLRNPSAGQSPIYVHRHDDGSFTAVLSRCTHRGCQVRPAGTRLTCPCHGSEFTPAGEVLEGPAERPLQNYDVAADASVVTVRFV